MVRGMHYDFKQKLNKIDSQQYRNLKVPEIDWKLNEAMYVFIKRIAQPRSSIVTGFEHDTRSINDIRTIVSVDNEVNVDDVKENIVSAELPVDFLYHISSSRCLCTKTECTVEIPINIQKHTRRFIDDEFLKSSFEWREVNGLFVGKTIHLYTDGSFVISKAFLDYIRKPLYLHNAQDAAGGSYNLPTGQELTGFQNCELPEHVHDEIVDLAVLITTGDLMSDYQAKFSKIQLVDN